MIELNKIFITFKSIEDTNRAMEALFHKVLCTYGSSTTELSINPSDRRNAIEILKEHEIKFTMR